jgi:hypothetical protein
VLKSEFPPRRVLTRGIPTRIAWWTHHHSQQLAGHGIAIEIFGGHFVGIRIIGAGIIGMDVFGTDVIGMDKRRHKENFSHDGSLDV